MAPFQSSIWIAICLMIFASMIVILLTKRLSKKWRHYYIGGQMNRSPILNMWIYVLGLSISNTKMSGRNFSNFARVLTILWTVQWLIIRSAHQGALYEYLHANRSTSPFDTIDKIRRSDCKVMTTASKYHLIKDIIPRDRYVLK